MILQSFRNLFQIPELRTKILFTAFFLIIFRLGSYIPIPGIDLDTLQDIIQKRGGDIENLLILFSTLTGGALSECAIFSLGIMPYISASIIFSLLVKVIPSLEALSKEGPSGYKKINEYTRYATVPLCLIQSYMIVRLFKSWSTAGEGSINLFLDSSLSYEILAIVTLTAGAIFLMWLGEQINEYGIGNGISLIIMAGIISRMPHQIQSMIKHGTGGTEIRNIILLVVLFVAVIGAVIYMTYGQRKISVQQAKHTKGRRVYGGQKHSLPLKVNQAGVMPVIFASSLMIFPMTIAAMITGHRGGDEGWFGWGSFWYIFSYIILIYFFSYFWTSLMFQPNEMSNQLKEYGSFIPGIRPGQKTSEYLEKVMVHITFVGAAFLCVIALIPQIVILGLDIKDNSMGAFISNLGGTSILIVVGVILDVVQKLESHLLVRNYDGFVKKGRIRGRR